MRADAFADWGLILVLDSLLALVPRHCSLLGFHTLLLEELRSVLRPRRSGEQPLSAVGPAVSLKTKGSVSTWKWAMQMGRHGGCRHVLPILSGEQRFQLCAQQTHLGSFRKTGTFLGLGLSWARQQDFQKFPDTCSGSQGGEETHR